MLVIHLHGVAVQGGYKMACPRCGMNRISEHAEEMHYCGVADGPRRLQNAASLPPQHGPGTELKALLKDWLGIESSPTCSCNKMAAKMNAAGTDWCETGAGLAEILGVMRTEHGKRWADGRTRLPWSDFGAKQLVRLACRRARAKAAS